MASIGTVLREKLSQIVFKALVVDEVRDLSPHFRRMRLSAPWLRTSGCAPGDKLQIMINEAGPRTFSPFGHDRERGTLDLLTYVHGDTQTAAWIRAAAPGNVLRGFGPRSSLALASLSGPVVFVGDETSFGAALSLPRLHAAADGVSCVFEVSDPEEATGVLRELSLPANAIVARQPGLGHLDALEQAVRAEVARHPRARLVLTGHAQVIQGLRKRLKVQPTEARGQTVKAYWADGKRGLD